MKISFAVTLRLCDTIKTHWILCFTLQLHGFGFFGKAFINFTRIWFIFFATVRVHITLSSRSGPFKYLCSSSYADVMFGVLTEVWSLYIIQHEAESDLRYHLCVSLWYKNLHVSYLTELSPWPLVVKCGVFGTLCAPRPPSQLDTHPVTPWRPSPSNIYTDKRWKVREVWTKGCGIFRGSKRLQNSSDSQYHMIKINIRSYLSRLGQDKFTDPFGLSSVIKEVVRLFSVLIALGFLSACHHFLENNSLEGVEFQSELAPCFFADRPHS